eukprot:2919238-Amphidinium_carterae.1
MNIARDSDELSIRCATWSSSLTSRHRATELRTLQSSTFEQPSQDSQQISTQVVTALMFENICLVLVLFERFKLAARSNQNQKRKRPTREATTLLFKTCFKCRQK